jgi:hypothetical protein
MRGALTSALAVLIALVCPALAAAADGSDDRLTLMADGSTISHAADGGGGSIGWLHNFNTNAIVGAAAEYQTIAHSHWSFGSLNVSLGRGSAERRSTFYADGHLGSGDDGARSFHYALYAAGLIQNVTHQFSVQLEDKQIDIGRTRGNLPKLGLQFLWSPHLLTTVSYSHSVSGNLGTRLGAARLDYYGKGFNIIAGGAGGQASPDIVDLHGLLVQGLTLREGFAGVGKPFSRVELTLLGDYIKLGQTERITLTLNCMVHLRSGGRSR